MASVLGDTLLSRLRKEKGMTQAELCEGICTVQTLSNLEKGKRPPNRWVFKQLMERLGENPDKYFVDVVTLDDRRVADLKEKLKRLLHERSEQGNKNAEALMNELEKDEAFKTKENQQFLLMNRVALALYTNNHTDARKHALKALAITKPNFDDDKIDTYALSLDEIWLVNQIAVAYFLGGSIQKSTDIFSKLKRWLETCYIDGDRMNNIYSSLMYNLSKTLGMLKKYEECVSVCDIGLEWCRKYRNSFHHPLFLFNKAYCLLHLSRKDEAVSLLRKVYALFLGLERYDELSYIKGYVEKEFGIMIGSLEF